MDDRKIIGGSDYIKLIISITVISVPIALLTFIFLALYTKGVELVRETLPAALNLTQPVCTILVATVGGLLVGLGLRYLGVRHSESLPKEMEAGRVPYQGVPAFVLTALIGPSSGASLGPEAPLGHMGAVVANWFAERHKLPKDKSRIMTLSGIAAAFGGFLATPLGGAFMSMEFTGSLTYPIYANLIAATTATLFGTLVVYSFTGVLPRGLLNFPEYTTFEWIHILYAVILGLVGLVWAFLFKIIFGFVTRLVTPLNRFPVLKPAVGGLVFGLVGAWLPLTLYSGEEELNTILVKGAEIGVVILLLLAVVKLFTLSVCFSSGFPGGFVFPLFFSAGSLGYAIHLLFPFIPLDITLVGTMAGVGGAVMRMPFTVVLVMILFSSISSVPVSIVAAFTGFLSATILEAGNARKAMYQAAKERREVYASSEGEANDDGEK
jgi:chloride channel protein, CIC family